MNFNHSFFSCDTCEYVADTKHSLKEHTAAEHDGVQCSYAGSRSKVYEHKKIKHEGVKYPCSECDYKAGCLCNLRQHTESTHKGVFSKLADMWLKDVWKMYEQEENEE